MAQNSKNSSNTIAFRVKDELLGKLNKDSERFGVSRGELVRAIVSLHYEMQPAALRDDISKLLTKVGMIHRNQARQLVSLLVTVGKVPLEDAKQIVRADLLS
jgi:hypothetical protein